MSKPPCYEEAVLMAEPPPPYSEVLTDTRGLYRKIVTPFLSRRDSAEKQEQPPPSYKPLFLDRGYTSAVHLPSAPRPAAPCPALCLQADRGRRVFPSWAQQARLPLRAVGHMSVPGVSWKPFSRALLARRSEVVRVLPAEALTTEPKARKRLPSHIRTLPVPRARGLPGCGGVFLVQPLSSGPGNHGKPRL